MCIWLILCERNVRTYDMYMVCFIRLHWSVHLIWIWHMVCLISLHLVCASEIYYEEKEIMKLNYISAKYNESMVCLIRLHLVCASDIYVMGMRCIRILKGTNIENERMKWLGYYSMRKYIWCANYSMRRIYMVCYARLHLVCASEQKK